MRQLLGLLAVWFALFVPGYAIADHELKVIYKERPSYYTKNDNGEMDGLVNGPVALALQLAGVEAVWEELPWNRQLRAIELDEEPVCSPGWFRNETREAFAKFSEPIYQDKPQILVARMAELGGLSGPPLSEILDQPDRILGVKRGYSYGSEVDIMIRDSQAAKEVTDQPIAGMINMLIRERFDFFLVAPEEYSVVGAALSGERDRVGTIRLADVPAGNRRYLMCSKSVDDELIQRFNTALAAP